MVMKASAKPAWRNKQWRKYVKSGVSENEAENINNEICQLSLNGVSVAAMALSVSAWRES
jgi:hypothetical protein